MNIIFLLGYMAVGKTTIAARLASDTGALHIDLDDWIARQCGVDVPYLINNRGEDAFRKIEREALLDVIVFCRNRDNWSGYSGVVVSVGGGTPCYADNMDVICRAGMAVWLRLSASVIVERLLLNPRQRPLVAGIAAPDMLHTVERHLDRRTPFYARAHRHLDIDGLSVEAAATAIASLLEI